MNTNIVNRDNYVSVISPLRNDDRDSCFRMLRSNENYTLCQGIYTDKYINCAVEQSDYVLLRRLATNSETIVAFALVKILKSKKLDILLVCTVPNKKRFGNMIAYDIYSFAVKKSCEKIYTEPRTSELRDTFVKYGFSHLRGIKDFNEVLEIDVVTKSYNKLNKTRKTPRSHFKTSFGNMFEELSF